MWALFPAAAGFTGPQAIVFRHRHRGTPGIPVTQATAIRAGVRKINYFTYMDKAGGNEAAAYIKSLRAEEPLFFSSISMTARDAMKENVKEAMKMFALE